MFNKIIAHKKLLTTRLGASVFGGMWADPNDPDWTKDIAFPLGSLVYKLIYTNATNDEVPMLEGAPSWDGVGSTHSVA